MYISLKKDGKLLCEVIISSVSSTMPDQKIGWSWSIHTFINIKNYSQALLEITEEFKQAQLEFVKDFTVLQNLREDFMEKRNPNFPEPAVYELSHPNFNIDKYKIIEVVRNAVKEVANKWGLQYNED